jgi:lysophospholipase L1-like esterase
MRPQSIPLEQFKANLNKIIDALKDPQSPYYSLNTVITLVSCPPLSMVQRQEFVLETHGPGITLDRSPERTKAFAYASGEVAKERGVGYVNAYDAIMAAAGPDPDNGLRKFFSDGLHLTAEGYKVSIYVSIFAPRY